MPKSRRDGLLTRQRLLESACELFSERGYRDATVAQICALADANVAAVNYHFGDKEALYRAAMQHAYEIASDRFPIDGGLSADAPAALRLQAYVEAQLRRTFSADAARYFPGLVVKEMAEPTGVVGDTLRQVLRPHREHLRSVLRQLLGKDASESRTRLCVMSIISQCYFFAFNRALRERHFGMVRVDESRLREMIVHITNFCLAGIQDCQVRYGGRAEDAAATADGCTFKNVATEGGSSRS